MHQDEDGHSGDGDDDDPDQEERIPLVPPSLGLDQVSGLPRLCSPLLGDGERRVSGERLRFSLTRRTV